MSTELVEIAKVDIKSTLGTITSNLKEVKARLDEEFKDSIEKKITKDEFAIAKKSLADARKLYKALEEKRKSIKKDWNTPYVEFEKEYKEATESLTKYANNLKEQIEIFEREETEKKLAKIQEIIDERLEKEPQSTKEEYSSVPLTNDTWDIPKEVDPKKEQMPKEVQEPKEPVEIVPILEYRNKSDENDFTSRSGRFSEEFCNHRSGKVVREESSKNDST